MNPLSSCNQSHKTLESSCESESSETSNRCAVSVYGSSMFALRTALSVVSVVFFYTSMYIIFYFTIKSMLTCTFIWNYFTIGGSCKVHVSCRVLFWPVTAVSVVPVEVCKLEAVLYTLLYTPWPENLHWGQLQHAAHLDVAVSCRCACSLTVSQCICLSAVTGPSGCHSSVLTSVRIKH